MGRKGNSKRKPKQQKSKNGSGASVNGAVSSVVQTADDKHIKSFEPLGSESVKKGSGKSSSDWNKNSKKG
jgi:hypothetical protein